MDILQESDSFCFVLCRYRIALSVSAAWRGCVSGLPHAEPPCSTTQQKRHLSVAQTAEVKTHLNTRRMLKSRLVSPSSLKFRFDPSLSVPCLSSLALFLHWGVALLSPLTSPLSPFAVWVTDLVRGSDGERLVLFHGFQSIPVGSWLWRLQCDLSISSTSMMLF